MPSWAIFCDNRARSGDVCGVGPTSLGWGAIMIRNSLASAVTRTDRHDRAAAAVWQSPRHRRLHGILLAMLLVMVTGVSFVTAAKPAEAATLPAGFSERTVISGLVNPTAVRFSSDGRVFVAEKRGVIKVFDSLTDSTPSVFADLNVNVYNFWSRTARHGARTELPRRPLRLRDLHLRPRARRHRTAPTLGNAGGVLRSVPDTSRPHR